MKEYTYHFIVVNQEISPKPSTELNISMLQSPDYAQVTYRKKNEKESFCYTINATETANPANLLQLIGDIALNPNNIDDSVILNK